MTDLTVEQQIDQLNQAKQLVLQDASIYPQVIRGILPIAQKPEPRLRSWCAAFLADGFASAEVNAGERQVLAVACLHTIEILFEETDLHVVKNLIQCSASIYPLIFKHICANKSDKETLHRITAIKSKILGLWDSGSEGIKICCIKFVQRVIAVQTPGTKDPRLADSSDVSLTQVPLDHPLIPHPVLEAEAQGLLDRLLSVFYEPNIIEPSISATLYAAGILIKSRSTIANKILTRMLAFDPLTAQYATSDPMRLKLELRFIEKNLRIVLGNVVKTSSIASQYGTRIQQYLAQLVQAKNLSVEDLVRKRAGEPIGAANIKRQRTDSPAMLTPPTRDVQLSYAQLYTLIDPSLPLTRFDVKTLPHEVATEVVIAGLIALNRQTLDNAIMAVRRRYNELYPPPGVIRIEESSANGQTVPASTYVDDDDDDYEPDYEPEYEPPDVIVASPAALHARQVLVDQTQPVIMDQKAVANKLLAVEELSYSDAESYEDDRYREMSVDADTFVLPPPKPLDQAERLELFQQIIERIFASGGQFENTLFADSSKKTGKDIEDLTTVALGGDIWIVLLSRLGTRGLSSQMGTRTESELKQVSLVMARFIREKLFAHVMVDFRARVDVAITWLNEEWYNDKMKLREKAAATSNGNGDVVADGTLSIENSPYVQWASKILDSVIPFLDAKDRVFLRFLSDLPELTPGMISKLRPLCRDPDRSKLGYLALQYLVKLRPPVREYCLELMESLKEESTTQT
ncbi:hypothetical protein V1517DRAFT_315366 [Lipomyces orientalis]|uniref:Uncharacterized protein n=1 Tax=Lipomyces orientalis TaxID=1233043 RepID=A0ACC3TWH7_9ASCO